MSVFNHLFTGLNRRQRRGICVTLTIKAYDEKGRLTGVRKRKSDLLLDNFGKFLTAILAPYATYGVSDTPRSASLKDISNVSRSVPVLANTTDTGSMSGRGFGFYIGINVTGFTVGTQIAIGTGTTPPARENYALGAQQGINPISEPSYSAGKIVFSTSITLGSSQTITESGVLMRFNTAVKITAVYYDFLMIRDTFAGVTGTTFTVEYTINL